MSEDKIPEYLTGYKIEEKIGEGGMGMVFRGLQMSMQRKVAIKVLLPSLAQDPQYIQRFMREAHSVGKLQHPNLVLGFDAGEDQGYYYFVMEFVPGMTLFDYLSEEGKLEEREAVFITLDVARALEHAWEHRIIHRDIKPQNIFLTPEGKAKLGDLGLAKPMGGQSITKAHCFMGTPHYISPEMIEGKVEIDIRSDIYSLGITLFQMVTGRVPHDEESDMAIMAKHLSEEIPSVKDVLLECSSEMEALVSKMTRRDREKRPADPTALVRDLESLLAMPDRRGKTPPRNDTRLVSRLRELAPFNSISEGTQETPAPAKILAVEDDPDILRLIVHHLEKAGYRVDTATDGVDALMQMGKERYDLFLIDVAMPKVDGFQLVEWKQDKGIDTPIIFLTAYDTEEAELRGFALGAEDYIVKPFRKASLLARIQRVLKE